MSKKKYNIKFSDGKIIGPLDQLQFDQLLEQQELTGDEVYQELPARKWQLLSTRMPKKQDSDNTLFLEIVAAKQELSRERQKHKDFINQDLRDKNVEFKGSRAIEQELEKKLTKADEQPAALEETQIKVLDKEKKDKPERSSMEKTTVRKLSEQEKREVLRLKEQVKASKEQSKEGQPGGLSGKSNKVAAEVKKESKQELVSLDEATKVASLGDQKMQIISEFKESEQLIKEAKRLARSKGGESSAADAGGESGGEKPLRKARSPLFLLLVAVVLALAVVEIMDMASKDAKNLRPIPPRIAIPLKLQFKEVEKSKAIEGEGDKLYQQGGYSSTLRASLLYAKSLGYDFDNPTVLGKLILSYAELYRDSVKRYRGSEVLMKLIRIAEKKIPNQINYITGAAIFFYRIDRPLSALNMIENFLKINKASTVKLIRYYMLALSRMGRNEEAAKAFGHLSALPEKDIDAYLGIAEYHMMLGQYEQAGTVFKEAAAKYPARVELLVEYSRVLLHQKNLSKLSTLLQGIKEVNFDRSVYFYSQYLKYMGILYTMKNKGDLAIKFFKKSLKVSENVDLRKKVDSLSLGATGLSKLDIFINENKTIRLIQKSEQALIQEKFNRAIAHAINAVDLNSGYYPAVKQLVKVQRIQGHFQSAISLLEKYIDQNISSVDARLDLIEVYIHAFKFSDAGEIFHQIKELSQGQERRYKFLLGKFFLFQENYIPAIKEFNNSLDKDPLNDEIFFILAKIYVKNNQFKEAKSLLIKAIELNPGIVAYRSLYGYALYELDGSDVAIGYVRKLMQEFKDNPLLMGDIAKYYYKSGQQKLFLEQLKKIKSFPRQSSELYRSLFESALLAGDVGEMIKYGKELVLWAPGDLATNIEFGEKLIEVRKYEQALEILNNTLNRLPSFPRLNYLIGKVYLAKGNVEKAIKVVEKEIENNPHIAQSYILLGQIYLKQKDLVKAKKYFTEAQIKDGENPDALYGMGYVVFLLGQYELALELFQKVGRIIPGEAKIKLMLGHTYEKMGQQKLAEESFRLYLELRPDAHDKEQVRAKIEQLK